MSTEPENAWALGPAGLEALADAIKRDRPGSIVECGSGTSTIVVARLLRELEVGRIWSLEHDAHWAAQTRERLAAEGLDRAEVITAPLEPHPLAGGAGWYARAGLAALPAAIDLLLIDGPPAGEPELRESRHPALTELGPRLTAGAVILLDDAGRPGERDAIALWEAQYPVQFEVQAESGIATARWQVYVAPLGGASGVPQ